MRHLQALRSLITSHKKRGRGQSLIEVALALPVLLIMISGLIEFGFALNQYLNALDAAREAARFDTDNDPLDRDFVSPGVTNTDCTSGGDFYMQAACVGLRTMDPVQMISTTDDVVISVFRVLSGTVIGRWPNCEPDATNDCPFDPSPYPDTMGEWHLYGRGDGCGNALDDDGDGTIDDGCGGTPANGASEACDTNSDSACNPSRITASLVQSRIDPDAPDSAVLVVEVFYDYPHVLSLPWITPFVPNPLPMHTYTVLPLPAAEPSLTITGTVRMPNPSGVLVPVSGVTIFFNNGMTAITDENGMYARTGLSSGWITWWADPSGTICEGTPIPASYNEHLTTSNLLDRDFELTTCIDRTATAVAATQTYTASVTLAAQTQQAGATQTVAAVATQTAQAGGTAAPGDTATPTPTNTVSPTCSDTTVSPDYSSVNVVGPTTTLSNDTWTIEVQVVVHNECDTDLNMDGRPVQLTSNRAEDTISPSSVAVSGGVATFFVRSDVMSNWDINFHDYAQSLFTARVQNPDSSWTTINDTAVGSFTCAAGVEATAVNANEVNYRFYNDTGTDLRLVLLEVSRSTPQSTSSQLIEVVFDALSVWSGATYLNPDWIFPGMWIDPPVNRHLAAGAAKDLLLVHDFTVTGGQSFTVIASWDNTSGSPDCASNTVTVVRP